MSCHHFARENVRSWPRAAGLGERDKSSSILRAIRKVAHPGNLSAVGPPRRDL
jgi:hypothetical protein